MGKFFCGRRYHFMQQATSENLDAIISYLKADIPNCIYLYIDITTYGVGNTNIKIWFDQDENGISLVLMKYFDSFQVYTRSENWDIDGVEKIIRQYGLSMISARKEMIEKLYERLSDQYHATYGVVFRLNHYRKTVKTDIVQRATEADVPEIVELMCDDEYYHDQYDPKELEAQLIERMRTGMGRNFIIRDHGKLVVHDATFAETDTFMVSSGFIVHRDYRSTYYCAIMEDFFINQIGNEGKDLYAFITEKRRIKFFQLMKNEIVAQYGKLTKIEQ